MINTVKKTIVSKSLLEYTAKVVKFSQEVDDFKILRTSKTGVYVAEVVGLNRSELPFKPVVRDIVDEHVLARDLVKDVLDRVPGTRDDDMLLLFEVWSRQGIRFDLSDADLSLLFNAETITRGRRKIQNDDGLFLPSSVVVAKRRRINEELLREYYGGLQ